MARAANGHLVTNPRLPPREGCRNIEVSGGKKGCVVGMEGSSVGVKCGQECGVYKSEAPSRAPETSGLKMVVYLLQFFKLGVPLGIGRQIFLLSSWKQRWEACVRILRALGSSLPSGHPGILGPRWSLVLPLIHTSS